MTASASKAENTVADSVNSRIPVWLIDDSEHFSHTASSILNESAEVECTRTFPRCETAIEALRGENDPPSVILLDIEMPGMGGLEAIKPLKKLAPSTQILMITAYDEDTYIRRAIARGASGYLLKNSSGKEFVRAILSAANGGMPIDPFIMIKVVKMIAQDPASSPIPDLTERERDILRLIKDGLEDHEIATELSMQYNTVLYHTKNIQDKFGVHSRRELIVQALKAGVL